MPEFLSMWTIYDHPTDHPDVFIARRWIIQPGHPGATSDTRSAGTLNEVRSKLPRGLILIPRQETDDENIVESWV